MFCSVSTVVLANTAVKCQPNFIRGIALTTPNCLIQKWRQQRGLPLNPNTHGPLTDKPDYSFLDGRPTPYGSRQVQRLVKQKELAEQVIRLSGEIDFAVERHKKLQEEKEANKKRVIANKLKPKGVLLLRDKEA